MPYVNLHPPLGPVDVFYYIATPKSHNADTILPGVPTLLFLHPTTVGSQIYEAQWADPIMRQFNLISLDMRVHGRTVGRLGSGPIDIAEDVRHFMDALDITSCHLFAMSMTCDTALELASKYPHRVLSMTLCSPLPREDSEMVYESRRELFQAWRDSFSFVPANNERGFVPVIDQDIINECIAGVKQLVFNMSSSPLVKAISDLTLDQWLHGITPEILEDAYRMLVEWFEYRCRISVDEMQKIRSPVLVIYFNGDIVYPLADAQDILDELASAGVSASLLVTDGAQYGCIDSAPEINGPVHEFIRSCYSGLESASSTAPVTVTAERIRGDRMKTPFYDILAKVGYDPADD